MSLHINYNPSLAKLLKGSDEIEEVGIATLVHNNTAEAMSVIVQYFLNLLCCSVVYHFFAIVDI